MSWVGIGDVGKGSDMARFINVIKKLKNSEVGDLTDRIMFGTDAPIDRFNSDGAVGIYKSYIASIHKAIKDNFGDEADGIIDRFFYKNAEDVYINKTWAQNPISTGGILKQKAFSKTALGLAFIGIGALVGIGIHHLQNKTKKTQPNISVKTNKEMYFYPFKFK